MYRQQMYQPQQTMYQPQNFHNPTSPQTFHDASSPPRPISLFHPFNVDDFEAMTGYEPQFSPSNPIMIIASSNKSCPRRNRQKDV